MSSAEAASRVPPTLGRPSDIIYFVGPGTVVFLVKYRLVTVTDQSKFSMSWGRFTYYQCSNGHVPPMKHPECPGSQPTVTLLGS
jgi:hypothetical protein